MDTLSGLVARFEELDEEKDGEERRRLIDAIFMATPRDLGEIAQKLAVWQRVEPHTQLGNNVLLLLARDLSTMSVNAGNGLMTLSVATGVAAVMAVLLATSGQVRAAASMIDLP
jgi:Lon protease-like protein